MIRSILMLLEPNDDMDFIQGEEYALIIHLDETPTTDQIRAAGYYLFDHWDDFRIFVANDEKSRFSITNNVIKMLVAIPGDDLDGTCTPELTDTWYLEIAQTIRRILS